MIRAKLKRLHSPDVDLQSYWPTDPSNFGFLLQAMIGPADANGEESFAFQVCTPEWLKSNHTSNEVLFGTNLLIVFDFDLQAIDRAISRYVENCTGDTWPDVADKIGRVAAWEFADYQPFEG